MLRLSLSGATADVVLLVVPCKVNDLQIREDCH